MTFNNFSKLKLAYLFLVLSLFSLVSRADSSTQDRADPASYYLTEASTSFSSGDWDIDDNGQADALTDGLMFLRYAFGLSGNSLLNGLISSDSVITSSAEIEAELATIFASAGDIDGNGSVDALTDGLLLLRYLFGLTGNTLTTDVIGDGAILTESIALEAYMSGLMPQAPYIKLNGSAFVSHEQATVYNDPGATATDVTDGLVEVIKTGAVDASVAGTYILSYSAIDAEGNVSRTLTRTVAVADTTAPAIVLLGESAVEVELDASYEDAGATATDMVDGVVEVVTTGSVDTSAAATYTLTYTATDSSGNIATTTREVSVTEPRAQTFNVTATNNGGWAYIINGVSKPDLTLEVGTTYTFNYPSSHPLRFSTVNDGIFNGGVEYTQDVDTSGTNQITIRVTSSTAKTLYYYCRIHARQGGKITVTQ
jgi:hypothetical protein